MPLYEYQCDECGHRFEVIQKFSDPPIERCPKCNGAVHKLQSAPAIQFKGTGWYVTDYARKDQSSSSGSSKDGATAAGKSASKTETSEKSDSTDKTDKSTKASDATSPPSSPSSSSSSSSGTGGGGA